MKPTKIRTILLAVACLALSAALMATAIRAVARQAPRFIKKAAPEAPRDALSAEETAQIRPGDLILIAGVRQSADLIILALREDRPFSHVGIAVSHKSGGSDRAQVRVIHSVHGALTGIDGVQANSLAEFAAFARPDSILVIRPRWKSPGQADLACDYAEKSLAEGIPFDDSYDWADSGKLYCGELVAKALDRSGIWHAAQDARFKANILVFSSFTQNGIFRPIIDHNQPRLVDNTLEFPPE